MPITSPETEPWTLEACRNAGVRHAAYGWTRSPYGTWTREQFEAYESGYAKESGGVPKKIVQSCLNDGTRTLCYDRQASWPGPWVWPDQAELPNDPELRARRREAYRAGAYTKTTPDIYHERWPEDAWCNWVDFHDKSLNGFMSYFIVTRDMKPEAKALAKQLFPKEK